MEASAVLTEKGHKCSMVFPSQHIMSRLWCSQLAEHYQEYFTAKGVKFISGAVAESFEEDEDGLVSCVKLSNGQDLPCKLVIVCTGATIPKHLFEQQLELQGRGVRVNGFMQSSLENVYCVGDLCSFYVKRLGRFEVMEHVKHARRSAEQAVGHIMGVEGLEEYDYEPFFYSRIFNLSWQFWGDPQGYVFVGCGLQDAIPGEILTLGAVWVSKKGRINGIMLESCSAEEQKLAEQIVRDSKAVSITLLKSVDSKEHLIHVLRTATFLSDSEVHEKHCMLSKAEIAKMLQQLPQEDYAYLGSEAFIEASTEIFWSKAPRHSGCLHGKALREAVCKLLRPHQADVVYCIMEKPDEITRVLRDFGGAPAVDLHVKECDFVSFTRFCLAWCLWCGFEVSGHGQVSKMTQQIQKSHIQLIEDLEVRLHMLSRDENTRIGKIVRKNFKDLADFLHQHVNDTVQESETDLLLELESMRKHLAESHRCEEELRKLLNQSTLQHMREISHLKAGNGAVLSSASEKMYDPLDCIDPRTRELVSEIVAFHVQELLAKEVLKGEESTGASETVPTRSFLEFQLQEKTKALETAADREQKLKAELQTVQAELSHMKRRTLKPLESIPQASSSPKNRGENRKASMTKEALNTKLTETTKDLEDARLQLQTLWEAGMQPEVVAAAQHSEMNELQTEIMNLRQQCATLTQSLSAAEDRGDELERKLQKQERDRIHQKLRGGGPIGTFHRRPFRAGLPSQNSEGSAVGSPDEANQDGQDASQTEQETQGTQSTDLFLQSGDTLPAVKKSANCAVCPIMNDQNAMQVHTNEIIAKSIPYIGECVSEVIFKLNQDRLVHACLCLLWILGFVSGCMSMFLPTTHDYAKVGILLTLFMLPAEVFPWLLFNRRITMSLFGAFETWFLLICLLVALISLGTMVGDQQVLFVLCAAPGILSFPFMDSYPVYLRSRIIKVYTAFNLVFWAFWMMLLHSPMGAKIWDLKLLEIGHQEHYAGQVCVTAIFIVTCFGLRNLWSAFRHPRWLVGLTSPLETSPMPGGDLQQNNKEDPNDYWGLRYSLVAPLPQ
eukprot:gnl/MRDRNA2_/MRDRNA2_34204_c0_seq1.p1 gnl/MRDRNA2_/MRDRNA2_34204_c0~~gnl/MRDRNA2_/MRDRNA2_34204_c0_seq1.p1  ORF type:complete len:1207 (+),score=222.34 gnl/MRDRNA2_/MRDRNA2_34204_c0_seq1:430-3621(+)